MADPGTLLDLLADPAASLTDRANPRWSLDGFERQVLEAETQLLAAGRERLLEVRTRLRQEFFPAIDSVVTRDEGAEAALRGATAADPRAAPSPLIPAHFELFVFCAPPWATKESELAALTAHAAVVLSGMVGHPEFRPKAAELLQHIASIYRGAAAQESATRTIEAALAIVTENPSDPPSIAARVTLLEAHYDNLAEALDHEPPLDDDDRDEAARKRLAFLDEVLRPAIDARAAAMAVPERERKRVEAAFTHRHLTFEAARASARREAVGDRSERWRELARVFDNIGEPENAANALSVMIDDTLEILEQRPADRERLQKPLDEVATDLERRLTSLHWLSRDLRALRRRVAEAFAVVDRGRAKPSVELALESLRTELTATRDDPFARSLVLSDADDWLGVLLQLERPPGAGFAGAYEVIRGRKLVPLAVHGEATTLRWYVTLRAAVGGLLSAGSEATWLACEEAHELARTLNVIRARSFKDVEEFRETKKPPASASVWSKLLERLVAQLSARKLAASAPDQAKWIIEVDGLGVHLPLAGALLAAAPKAKAILTSILGAEGVDVALPSVPRAVVINAFTPGEDLYEELERCARVLGVQAVRVRNAIQVREAFAEVDRSFVVFGCHGEQRTITGAMELAFPDGPVDVGEVFSGLRLKVPATILAFTCFGGAGESLPALLLRAGARVVVANRWHAWIPLRSIKIDQLLRKLLASSVSADPWASAEATTAFVADARSASKDPRDWCGWGTWVGRIGA